MITFDLGRARFNYRVVGVALHAGRVLIHRAETDDFWTLPGGRAEPLEPAAQTIDREMREELGLETKAERLVWVVEDFFEHADQRWPFTSCSRFHPTRPCTRSARPSSARKVTNG